MAPRPRTSRSSYRPSRVGVEPISRRGKNPRFGRKCHAIASERTPSDVRPGSQGFFLADDAGRWSDGRAMKLHRLTTVNAFVAFVLDDCEANAGGTRFAPDVTEAEVALLARVMTYRYAVLRLRMGGAK